MQEQLERRFAGTGPLDDISSSNSAWCASPPSLICWYSRRGTTPHNHRSHWNCKGMSGCDVEGYWEHLDAWTYIMNREESLLRQMQYDWSSCFMIVAILLFLSGRSNCLAISAFWKSYRMGEFMRWFSIPGYLPISCASSQTSWGFPMASMMN